MIKKKQEKLSIWNKHMKVLTKIDIKNRLIKLISNNISNIAQQIIFKLKILKHANHNLLNIELFHTIGRE